MRVATVVGARPQFIKASVVSRALRRARDGGREIQEVIVHSGQHYDDNMSRAFFAELEIPNPAYHLGVGGLPHGALTGRILERLENVLVEIEPDVVLVYGDTDTTLAGALAAAKLHMPVAHVEAGLRSFNRKMPEEVNRVVADHVADLLFCPTRQSIQNLVREGIDHDRVYLVGDVMYDVALWARGVASSRSAIIQRLGLGQRPFALATVHREENSDCEDRLRGILEGLARVAARLPVVLPLHPRTRQAIERLGWHDRLTGFVVLQPQPYFEMAALESGAAVIFTDSGGVQKEAFFYKVPCVTLRAETEWVETVALGWNLLADADPARIEAGLDWAKSRDGGKADDLDGNDTGSELPYGDGRAADKIADILWQRFGADPNRSPAT